MVGEYKAPCGCKIHVAQWTVKRKAVTQESCPLHKAAKELLEALKETVLALKLCVEDDGATESVYEILNDAEHAIAKAEGESESK